jgi:hypothetical protein
MIERERMFCAERRSLDRIDHEGSLDVKVFRSPRDFGNIDELTSHIRARVEPQHELELPARLRKRPRGIRGSAEHDPRNLVRHQQLGARAEAVVAEYDHGPT